jgi:hypothetical protein
MCAVVVEDKIFRALADPSRRAIFESLTRGEAAVKGLGARHRWKMMGGMLADLLARIP